MKGSAEDCGHTLLTGCFTAAIVTDIWRERELLPAVLYIVDVYPLLAEGIQAALNGEGNGIWHGDHILFRIRLRDTYGCLRPALIVVKSYLREKKGKDTRSQTRPQELLTACGGIGGNQERIP